MRRVHPMLYLLLALGLLFTQVSGLHMHADDEGARALHGTHFHDAGIERADHEGDTDVSLFELGSSWLKVFACLVAFAFVLFDVVGSIERRVPIAVVAFCRDRVGWRPPLRAPPLPIS